jgi:hypothetical protein
VTATAAEVSRLRRGKAILIALIDISTMCRTIIACWALLFVCVAVPQADASQAIRRPLGVYAKVDVETAIQGYPGSVTPSPAQLHSYLRALYADLLANPAISGITVGMHWDNIQLSETIYDWSYLDDAFDDAIAARKPVQLIITPGFNSPQWLLAKIPSCDGLFNNGIASADCGSVTFEGFPQEQHSDNKVLPLPWNGVYKGAWLNLLTQLNARYSANPAFVSIAVAGPTGPSDEMILPTTANDASIQPSGLLVDDTWAALIKHSFPDNSSYQGSDQVFIDEWKQVIDAYERIFSGVTLSISPDAGNDLPTFGKKVTPHPDNVLYVNDCAASIASNIGMMSCEAKTEILSYFVSVTGSNEKVTRVGGMTASSPDTLAAGDIGIAGVKLLTLFSPPLSPPFLGGAEFDHPVSGSNNFQDEGCPSYPTVCAGLTVEEAAYHVLTVFFNGTEVAASYGGTPGNAHMHYLEVPYVDVQYAETHPTPAVPSSIIGNMSLQDLLNRASHDLAVINAPRRRAARH